MIDDIRLAIGINQQFHHQLWCHIVIERESAAVSNLILDILDTSLTQRGLDELTGISSLAGYCPTSEGHMLAFCIINQGVMKNAEGREFQDRVCKVLCE